MKLTLSVLLIVSICFNIVFGEICRCKIPTVREAFDSPSTKRVVWGTIQYTWGGWGSNTYRYAIMQVNRQFKSCSFFSDGFANLIIRTPAVGPCSLKIYQAQSLFVPVQSIEQESIVSVCDGLRPFKELSQAEINYIESRSSCPKDQGIIKLPTNQQGPGTGSRIGPMLPRRPRRRESTLKSHHYRKPKISHRDD